MRKNVKKLALHAAGLAAVAAVAFASLGGNGSGTAHADTTSPGRKALPLSAKPVLPTGWPVLRKGADGADVTALQHLLTAAGRSVDADGEFGPATEHAVKAFQTSHKLTANGVVGADTWKKLAVTVREGSRGPAVRAVQVQLAPLGQGVAVDGDFGPATAKAVKALQSRHKLSPTGVVDAVTWQKLLGDHPAPATGKPAPQAQTPVQGNPTISRAKAEGMLKAAGIRSDSTNNCGDRKGGCTAFEGVRLRSVLGVIAMKNASHCPVTITGGTEPGHDTRITLSHAKGYKLDVRIDACITQWIKTHRQIEDRGNDNRWAGSLNGGISAEYVYEIPDNNPKAVHWDITFS
ncbi:peptidoglycan-binding domain-containing protein [Streptomyces lavendulae]|uniref:peptidoglycan-binding domain-containing protein n=1 Tax=Streptomyces lavendulae TaxID=1914 RepID=UPI003679277A